MTSRFDPRLGLARSALSKFIRRGMVDEAVAAARELASLNAFSLDQRLGAVTCEDVGWQHMPDVRAAVMAGRREDEESWSRLDLVAALAAAPKDRTAGWLAAATWGAGSVVTDASPEAYRAAIAEGDHRAALAIAFAALEGGLWPGEWPRVLSTPELGPAASEIRDACLWRVRLTRSSSGEATAGIVLAAIDQPRDVPHLKRVEWHDVPLPDPLPWYVADQHTDLGRAATAQVARERGLPVEVVAALQFDFESILCGPETIPCRWADGVLELDGARFGWGSPEEGRRLWSELRDDVRAAVEGLQRRSARREAA